MAAKGYWNAFQEVKKAVLAVLEGKNAGDVLEQSHGDWYLALFGPSVAAGIFGHPQAFSIAVINLVRNAFEHTLDNQGPVSVVIKDNELIVSNHTNKHIDQQVTLPAEPHITNNGLGLGIVQRLCEKNNWTFSLSTSENLVVARLSWWVFCWWRVFLIYSLLMNIVFNHKTFPD